MRQILWPVRKIIHNFGSGLQRVCMRPTLRTSLWTIILILLLGSMLINMALEQVPTPERVQRQLGYKDYSKLPNSTQKTMAVDPFAIPKKIYNFNTQQKSDPQLDTPNKARAKIVNINTYSKGNKTLVKLDQAISKREAQANANDKKKEYLIHWYNPPPYIKNRPSAQNCGFKKCKFSNCAMTFKRKDATKSDAVLFDGRWVFEKVGFQRPKDQIWIFAAHEAPITFEDLGAWWKKPQWRYGFNWTMTYDKSNTDIYLPYGEILRRKNPDTRNFKKIAKLKTKGALMINSHCPTESYREVYVEKLKKYIDIDILGKCGTPWNCGTHYVHDKCFDLLNTTYKFFLAFENAFCRQYYSEKIYENFKYDTIIISRGGKRGDAKKLFPKGTFISTDDFKSIEELGKYLQTLSRNVHEYANILRTKSQYFSPGYTYVYQRAMCDLCERLNNQGKYRKHIPDIVQWAYKNNPCVNATDLH